MSATLYDAAGGHPAVVAMVDGFYDRLTTDSTVRHRFSEERLPSLKEAQVRWFTAVLQGQEAPSDLRAVHAHLDITDREVEVVLGHLGDVLTETGADPRLRRGILSLVGRLWHARDF